MRDPSHLLKNFLEESTNPIEENYSLVLSDSGVLFEQHKKDIEEIVNCACTGSNKAVLAVFTTLALKKIISPSQDIRMHQKNMAEGFSGRTFDSKVVTPFFRDNDFPFMQSGSGWLTRSLEQASSYSLSYPGRITPEKLKIAFLRLVNDIQNGSCDPSNCLREEFSLLVKWRELSTNLKLFRPRNQQITNIAGAISNHWKESSSGSSKLPVLALYAAYQCLVNEAGRYKGHDLLELLSHTSADAKTNRVGDIDVSKDGSIVESVDVKHDIPITTAMVESVLGKIKSSTVKRYYILSTKETISLREREKIKSITSKLHSNYGCQIIINGVSVTLKYYLRLLSDTDKFLDNYVTLLEEDEEVAYQTKICWNGLWDRGKSHD